MPEHRAGSEISTQLEGVIRTFNGTGADPEGYSATAEAFLEKMESPIRVAIGGEFSSGKSSLVKMMLGAHVVTPGAAASAVPTVRFHYASKPSMRLHKGAKTLDIKEDTKLSRADLLQYERMDVGIDLALLRDLEIFDTPGTSDPNRTTDQLRDVAKQVDFIIWCTNATQAWRQSERQMFAGLDEQVRRRSLLVVTHVDLPRVKASLSRLMARLEKEAGPSFHTIIPMEVLNATEARGPTGSILNSIGWSRSGGEAFFATLRRVMDEVRRPYVDAAREFLATVHLEVCDRTAAAPPIEKVRRNEEGVTVEGPEPDVGPDLFMTLWAKQYGDFLTIPDWADPPKDDEMRAYVVDLLRSFGAGSPPWLIKNSRDAAEIQSRLIEAAEYLEMVSSAALPDGFAAHAQATLSQLDWEFGQLATGR